MGATTLLVLVLAGGPGWSRLQGDDGIEIFARQLPEERYPELRLEATSSASVESLCSAVFGTASIQPGEPAVTERKLIEERRTDDGFERVTYERVNPPVVSARDFALRKRKQQLPNGGCRISFSAANELAPKVPPGFVRIDKLRGSWEFQPRGTWTRITYTVFSDPGGSIPPVFVHASLRSTAVDWVKFVERRAEKGTGYFSSGLRSLDTLNPP